jgi:hypothetical protein
MGLCPEKAGYMLISDCPDGNRGENDVCKTGQFFSVGGFAAAVAGSAV